MTFDFRSVPCCDRPTVTFFPGLVECSLRHFLEEQGITGWSIISMRDALIRFPDTKIPEDIRLCPGSPRVEKRVKCLVSYYDPDAMYAEILKVNDSPENRDYLAECSEQYLKEEECAMENQHPNPAARPYPWYDDRVEAVRKADPAPQVQATEEPTRYTPKEIYAYLDRLVWKQDEAKRAASVIMYQCLHGIKSNAMFIGPSDCGKTHVWRCLQKLYPNRIEIVDGSNITQDGWKGSKKWADLLRSPIFRSGDHTVLVLDEADKMLAPKFSHEENVSHSIQSEGLTMLEGTRVDVKIDSVIHSIDTSTISFVLCGAFSNKANAVAEKDAGGRIGFGAAPKPVQPYARHLGEADLIEFGVMPEFLGRIERLVPLDPMTEEDYFRMTDSSFSLLSHIQDQYKADIRLSPQKRRELAEMACRTGLGVRGMESQIRRLVDDAIFDDCQRHYFEF